GGPLELDALRALEGLIRPLHPVLLAVRPDDGVRVPRHHLLDVEQLSLPPELAVPRALEADLVEVELDLAEQVVLVPWRALDDVEAALRQAGRDRGPGHAPPLGIHVAEELEVGRPVRAPAPARQPAVSRLPLEIHRIDETELVRLALELPLEVLGLAVEERPVVLAHVRPEEPVGAIGGADGPDSSQRRNVGPG